MDTLVSEESNYYGSAGDPRSQTGDANFSVPQGAIEVVAVPGHGGAGTSRLVESMLSNDRSGRFFIKEEAPVAAQMPNVHPGVIRLLVVRATVYGASTAVSLLRQDSENVVVAAVEDGIVGPRVPKIVRTYLGSITSLAPVVMVPFVHTWRYNDKAAPSARYSHALKSVSKKIHRVSKSTGGRQ